MSQRTSSEAAQRLESIAHAYWEALMKRNPVWATDLGDNRYDDLLPDQSMAGRAAYFDELRGIRNELQQLPAGSLSGQPAITHEVLRGMLELELEGEPHLDEQWTLNPLHGPLGVLTDLAERQPVAPRAAFEKLVSRFSKVPAFLQQIEANLREGMGRGQTAARISAERIAAQIRRMLEIPPTSSSFVPPAKPENMSDADFDALRQELADVVAKHVYPALAAHADFLEQSYLPHARTKPGLCHMPGGAEFYQYLIRMYTGSTDSAQAIHETGREELRRIHDEMRHIAADTLGCRDVREAAERLRGRPDQYLSSREELLDHNRALLERASAALPDYFSLLPTRRCEVRAVESFKEADSPSGYYCHASDDGSRPAYYYVNTYKPEQRPLFNMEALAFHEALPGHHLQIAIAQDLELPNFRRHIGQTAFIEGWALYTERLSDEMRLYSSQITRFGMLNYQAWRAARLVIDTGLHALGWGREQAIQEFLSLTAHTEHEATVEVDRYISMPGQALSYMLGRMQFDHLRSTARDRLGSRFDLKEFHARVLENGAVPLASLERIVDRWLTSPGA